MEPGTVYSFPLENGLTGTCRVIRKPEDDNEKKRYRDCVLAHATKWVGEGPVDLKSGELRKVVRTNTGPLLMWIKGRPPADYQKKGTVSIRKAEASKKSSKQSVWKIFQNVVFKEWQAGNEPEDPAAIQAQANQNAEQILKQRLEDLRQNETIDLSKVAPLKKPQEERTAEEVVRGFIAAMHQWEKECGRIDRKHPNSPVGQFAIDAQQTIFDEFCTAKERKYGRLGSYCVPPEYDPRTEKIIGSRECTRSRMEVDTQEKAGFQRENTYVVLKKKGCWLIDSRKSNGSTGIL